MQDVNGVLSVAAIKTEKFRRQIHLPKRASDALKEHCELSLREGFTTTPKEFVFRTPGGTPLRYQHVAIRSFKHC